MQRSVQGFELGVLGFRFGFRVYGLGFREWVFGCRVEGLGFTEVRGMYAFVGQ